MALATQPSSELATQPSIQALLPETKEDPLSREGRRERNVVLLLLLETSGSGETALGILEMYQRMLKRYNPAIFVSMFPEKDFNALHFIEYILNDVKVIMDDPKEFMRGVSDKMAFWTSTISLLGDLLMKTSLLDQEQALRVEACYKDIVNAIRRCIQISERARSGNEIEADDSQPWQPFFKTSFSTWDEMKFMTNLREIYINAQKSPTADIFQKLEELCKSTDLSCVTRSDLHTHTAMRMMMSIVEGVLSSKLFGYLNWERYTFLLSSFSTLNCSAFPRTTVSVCFRNNAANRVQRLRSLLERAHAIYGAPPGVPDFVDFRTPRPQSSALWQKLGAPEAAILFADREVFTRCAICQKGPLKGTNFAILDKCPHLYCVGCIFSLFRKHRNSKCPECGVTISEYTSKDLFLSYVRKRSSEENSVTITSSVDGRKRRRSSDIN